MRRDVLKFCLQVATAQRQRAEPPSPDPSDSESLSGDSDISSENFQLASEIADTDPPLSTPSVSSSTLSPGKSNTINNNKTQSLDPSITSTTEILLPPPTIMTALLWRRTAPLIFQNQDIFPIGLTTKSSSDGKIYVKTSSATQFHLIQKTLLVNKIDFHTFSFAADRQLKVVIKVFIRISLLKNSKTNW